MDFLDQNRDVFSGYFSITASAKDTKQQASPLFMLNFAAFMLTILNFPPIVGWKIIKVFIKKNDLPWRTK